MSDANLQSLLVNWLQQQGHSGTYRLQVLAGGDINETFLLTTDDGGNYCLKQNLSAPADFFACEAEGLAAIAASKTLRVPRVYVVQRHFIVMEYLKPAAPGPRYWQNLGEQLVSMHSQATKTFGFVQDNYCGRLRQINTQTGDGYEFFREYRLVPQGEMAMASGQLDQKEFEDLLRFAERLPQLVPAQEPALLHGDLWAGNIHCCGQGEAALIDPAAYWGWPEADLAMTLLFGGFDEEFYRSYENARPLEPGWRQRAEIYNVYHLLNHANLFGGGYARSAMSIIRRYL